MRFNRYALLLIAPLPVALLIGYYAGFFVESMVREAVLRAEDKQYPQVPDFEVKEIALSPEVFEVLSEVKLKRGKVQKQVAEKKEVKAPPSYRLSFTYVGPKSRYAIINGRLVKEGEMLSEEERVIRITRKGVLLSGRWGRRWLWVGE